MLREPYPIIFEDVIDEGSLCIYVEDVLSIVPDLINYLLKYKNVLIVDTISSGKILGYIKTFSTDDVKMFDNTYYVIENTAFGVFTSSSRIDYSQEDIDIYVTVSNTPSNLITGKKFLQVSESKYFTPSRLPSKLIKKNNNTYSCTLL